MKCPVCRKRFMKKSWEWYNDILTYTFVCRNGECRHQFLSHGQENKIDKRKLNNQQEELNKIQNIRYHLLKEQKDIPREFIKVLDENFFDLVLKPINNKEK